MSALPPGPHGLLAARLLALAFLRNRLVPLQQLAERYGDVAFFTIRGNPFALLNHPDHVRDVLVTRHRMFHKGVGLERARVLLGNGLLTSEDAHHQRQRRLLQPAFHRDRVAGYAATMVTFAERYVSHWREAETRDISQEMAKLTLAIAGKTLFDTDVEDRADVIGSAVTQALSAFDIALMPYGERLVNWPIPQARRFRHAKARLDEIVYRMIADRRAAGAGAGRALSGLRQGSGPARRSEAEAAGPPSGEVTGHDVLSMLIAARDEDDGRGMTDEEVRDEVMTLLLAGHETTANALTWTWYLLSQHPDARARAQAEVRQVCDGRVPSLADLPCLTYTRAVLSESMRLFPPAYLVGRRALEEYRVPGTDYVLPPRTVIFVSQYLLHRDARFWDAATEFRPERWLEGDPSRHRFAYFPFGAGPRVCIGEQFAWMEGVLVLATIAARWRLDLAPGQRIDVQPTITLRAKYGMRMRISAG
jgi:cytochrome P450